MLTALIIIAAGAFAVFFEGWRKKEPPGFDIRFGIIEADGSGAWDVARETTVIPLLLKETGFCFGYSISPPDNSLYTTREVLSLPAPPRHIEFAVPVEKREGGRVLITPDLIRQDRTVYPYSFSEGDPLGPWKLEIYINDQPARTIRFQVIRA
ncbi:MAG: hypothetical protein AB1641_08555 [Thermodesulfobacteriota bacterium]